MEYIYIVKCHSFEINNHMHCFAQYQIYFQEEWLCELLCPSLCLGVLTLCHTWFVFVESPITMQLVIVIQYWSVLSQRPNNDLFRNNLQAPSDC